MAVGALFTRACCATGGGPTALVSATVPSGVSAAGAATRAMRHLRPSVASSWLPLRPRQQLLLLPEVQVRHRHLYFRRKVAPHYGPPPWIQPLLPWTTKRNVLPPKPPSARALEPIDLHINVKRSKRIDVEAIDREIIRRNAELLASAGEYATGIGAIEAIKLLKAFELHPEPEMRLAVKLDVTPGVQHPRASLRFPKPLSLNLRFLVFAEGNDAIRAWEAGATYVGGEKLVYQTVRGELQFDRVLCTPDMYRTVQIHLAKILGPKGLMPTARRGTMTSDIPKAIEQLQGITEFVANDENVMAINIAKHHFTENEILANIRAVLRSIEPLGTPIAVTISTSSGLEILLQMSDLLRAVEDMDKTEATAAA